MSPLVRAARYGSARTAPHAALLPAIEARWYWGILVLCAAFRCEAGPWLVCCAFGLASSVPLDVDVRLEREERGVEPLRRLE